MVARTLWERLVWVQIPAPRQNLMNYGGYGVMAALDSVAVSVRVRIPLVAHFTVPLSGTVLF